MKRIMKMKNGLRPGLLVALVVAIASLERRRLRHQLARWARRRAAARDRTPRLRALARRCSKCHSLSRPLGSGITDDAVWIAYVDKMRRQPGSGISPQDAGPILRFLHYYSSEQRRIKRERDEASGGPANPALSDAASPPVSPKTATAAR